MIPFRNHTFKVLDDEKMQELMESIDRHGILQPAIAFYNEEGELELISGHRRHRASVLLGLETLPVLIKSMTRDEAIICMGETNLQSRESILPSEKAFTYKAMYDAMKRQGKRVDLTSDPLGQKLTARQKMSEKVGEGEQQIRRYIRLTYLLPELLNLVDIKRMGMRVAVELSYLPADLQQCIFGIYEEFEITPSHAQAIQLRKLHQERLLDEEQIDKILMQEKPNQREGLKLSGEIIDKYLGDCETRLQMENKIIRALALLEKQERIQGKHNEKDNEIMR